MKTSSGIELAVLITLMIAGTGRFSSLQAILDLFLRNFISRIYVGKKISPKITRLEDISLSGSCEISDAYHFVLDCRTLSEPEVESRDVPRNESPFGTRSYHSCSGQLILWIEGKGQHQVSGNVRRLHYSLREVSYLTNRGNCCWKVFSNIRFRGQSETVGLGYTGPVQLYKVKSIRKVQCV